MELYVLVFSTSRCRPNAVRMRYEARWVRMPQNTAFFQVTLSDGRPGLLICTGWHLTVYDYKNIGSEGTASFQHIQIRLAPACFPIGYGLPGDVKLLGQLFLDIPLFLSILQYSFPTVFFIAVPPGTIL